MLTLETLLIYVIAYTFALVLFWLLFGVLLFLVYRLKGGKKRFLKFYKQYIDLL